MNVMRNLLLRLSCSDNARNFLVGFTPSQRIAYRFVAGEQVADVLTAVEDLNRQGLLATIDHLGEHVASLQDAQRAAEDYCRILQNIVERGAQSTISIKLTNLGLDLDEQACVQNATRILKTAEQYSILIEIDMESSAYTDRTLQIYTKLRERFRNVLVCLQAYLYRTRSDIERLIEQGANVRLCKGAYNESARVAYQRRRDVDANYIQLLKLLFSARAQEREVFTAVATHDSKIIECARAFAAKRQLPSDTFEFQMLYGVRRALQQQLVNQGHRVRVYVPFGVQWYPYLMRRLAERPANLAFAFQSLVRE